MLVSVIVPVRNEAAHIRQTLDGLRAQDFDSDQFEVIVVDGDSEDTTAAVAAECLAAFRHAALLSNPKRLSSAARNVGVRRARGRYVVIVDGHCTVPTDRYLANVVRAFEKSGADCLGRPQPLRHCAETPFQQAVSLARESWLGHNPDSDNFADRPRFVAPDNVAVAYRREVFDRVGLFDESFDACEDVEFNTRVRLAGLTCYFTPAIRIDYQPRATLRGLLYQMARYGRGRSRLGRKHPSSVTLPSLAPALWLAWLPLTFILGFVSAAFAAAFCLSLLLYASAVAAESLRLSWRRSLAAAASVPVVFAAIHIGFGWGFLGERLGRLLPSGARARTARPSGSARPARPSVAAPS